MDNNNTYLYILVEYSILLNFKKISLLSLSLCIYAVYCFIASLTLLSSAEWSQVMDFTHIAASYSRVEIVTGWRRLHVTDWSVQSDLWQHVRQTTDIRHPYRQSSCQISRHCVKECKCVTFSVRDFVLGQRCAIKPESCPAPQHV